MYPYTHPAFFYYLTETEVPTPPSPLLSLLVLPGWHRGVAKPTVDVIPLTSHGSVQCLLPLRHIQNNMPGKCRTCIPTRCREQVNWWFSKWRSRYSTLSPSWMVRLSFYPWKLLQLPFAETSFMCDLILSVNVQFMISRQPKPTCQSPAMKPQDIHFGLTKRTKETMHQTPSFWKITQITRSSPK